MNAENLYETFQRELYHGEWAERVAIGHLLTDPKAPETAIDFMNLHAEDFYFANTRTLYKAIERLYVKREEIDIVNVVQALENGIGELGGLYMLKDCIERAQNTKHTVKMEEVFAVLQNFKSNRHVLFLLDRMNEDEPPSQAIS